MPAFDSFTETVPLAGWTRHFFDLRHAELTRQREEIMRLRRLMARAIQELNYREIGAAIATLKCGLAGE